MIRFVSQFLTLSSTSINLSLIIFILLSLYAATLVISSVGQFSFLLYLTCWTTKYFFICLSPFRKGFCLFVITLIILTVLRFIPKLFLFQICLVVFGILLFIHFYHSVLYFFSHFTYDDIKCLIQIIPISKFLERMPKFSYLFLMFYLSLKERISSKNVCVSFFQKPRHTILLGTFQPSFNSQYYQLNSRISDSTFNCQM